MPFQRSVLAEIGDQLLQHVGIEDRALHVLRSRIFATLELQHLQAALGHGERRRIAGHAGTDDDGVEFLLDHGVLLCWRMSLSANRHSFRRNTR
jgi:hypothetical protein